MAIRIRILMAMALVAVSAVAVQAPASAAATTVVGVGSGRCLDVIANNQNPGTGVNIFDCNGQANQAWNYTAAGEFRIYADSRCLDVAGHDTTAPAVVQIYTCNGGANQRWTINANGSITGVESGLCLDVTGAGTANSTVVGLWTCNGQSNQRWTTTVGGGDTQAPTVPGNARVSNLLCNSVTFAWNAATDNVGVAFYDIYHDGQQMSSVSGSTLSTTLTVVPGVTWGLYVNARDAAGNVSQASTTVTITPPQCQADTTPPTAPTALTGSGSGTTVSLSWTAATDNVGVRSYDIYRNATKVGTVTGAPPAPSFIDSGLAANTGYQYYVRAQDAQANVSPASNTITVTTGASCGSGSVCTVRQVTTDTDIPWGLVTLPDGTVLYNRRDAQDIIRLNPSTGVKTTVGTVPNVQSTDGEGGLLGLAISPNFASDRWLYIMHTSPSDNRIVRIRLETNNVLNTGSEQVLLSGILRNKFHNGGRLRFGPDGKLYASTGDAQNGDNAQNINNLAGKVLRLNTDGTVPSDNPFGNYVWSYGHRNPQGLAFDSQGRLWEQEFGNAIMDETNLITKGGNYGWPACEGTSGTCGTAGFIAPKRTYSTAEGSCSGIAVVRDVLYVACARGTRMYRAVISGTSLTNVQTYFNGTYGRLRTVEPAPDGGLWLTTTNLGDKDSTPNNSNEKILHVTLGL
ncbi:glucose/arabinose dehydrogenase [Allocatelliglobosispora scoriae]|uniref:Glucose/arabinose dehydrogenase n=1 Tax=Allocatelliglobosispora scoriae TaxID=643052 RepID=A0A841C378_9ACTN|nr:PQQ-dependent sugar dehydrogenase [Allocatelliglobosispora scoriae]MBB5873502.1 glucose/arabinose dehydrogenase [Allocatelliglobosispora scoriae]